MARLHRVGARQLRDWIGRWGVTRALLPPALCQTLAEGPQVPQPFSRVFTGGGPIFPDLVKKLSDYSLTAVYGSTEAEPIAHLDYQTLTQNQMEALQQGRGLLAGKPVDSVQVQIRDQEIWVAGDHVNQGYLNPAHDQTTKAYEQGRIWHRTGDAGDLDADGNLWLLGRWQPLEAKSSPYFPFQVELVAQTWPGVRRAALVHSPVQDVLVLEGEKGYAPQWAQKTDQHFPGLYLRPIRKIPVDRRHRSKIDYAQLQRFL